tara:strand:- start:2243 stop:2401 length:159 start_codon:yes stop_codon:yes gene_type:complete
MVGIDPNTFWQMSVYEITLTVKGFKEFHSGKKESKPMTAKDVEKLKERYPDF